MSDSYRQLLEATLQHVEGLKARGVRHLAVAPETLRALAMPPPRTAAPPPEPGGSRREEAPARKSEIRNPKSEMDSSLLTSAATNTASPPIQSALATPHSAFDKSAAFAALRERALACVKCPHLASSRKNVVFGVGSLDAQLMFVGEAPGADEDEQGEPFVGAAGLLLTRIIIATGLSRAEVYIANILKCRPDTPGESAGNRKPTPAEMASSGYRQQRADHATGVKPQRDRRFPRFRHAHRGATGETRSRCRPCAKASTDGGEEGVTAPPGE